ncbi:hypothetical protein [uncultured Thiodictyon sp.]|uniref:hypothetical protein n=1 Tax=uncultured Thiodictyon sp. TaxID=1846217 RepID=UPI0025E19FB6|nr:hypothetical protein [uncultured Thiodictyon sp.]
MWSLTEDMGRLRDEIARERIARQTLINDNRQEVTDAAHAFMREFKVSVETMRVDRIAFLTRLSGAVADMRVDMSKRQAKRKQEVAHLLDDFQRARGVMAIEVRAADQAFVSDIARTAHQLLGEFAGQRSATCQAWYGQTSQPAALTSQPAPTPKMKDPVETKPQVQAKAQAKSTPKDQHKVAAYKEQPMPVEKSAMAMAMDDAQDGLEHPSDQ